MTNLPCHICGKQKGQPPERCNGHYEPIIKPRCEECGSTKHEYEECPKLYAR
jgi:hypothetical protein